MGGNAGSLDCIGLHCQNSTFADDRFPRCVCHHTIVNRTAVRQTGWLSAIAWVGGTGNNNTPLAPLIRKRRTAIRHNTECCGFTLLYRYRSGLGGNAGSLRNRRVIISHGQADIIEIGQIVVTTNTYLANTKCIISGFHDFIVIKIDLDLTALAAHFYRVIKIIIEPVSPGAFFQYYTYTIDHFKECCLISIVIEHHVVVVFIILKTKQHRIIRKSIVRHVIA